MVAKLTKNEIVVLDKATDDFFDTSYTELVCPRCGNKLSFSKKDSSFQIKCKSDDCIKMTTRGI